MQFTKEAQELAKPCYEAIKKIAERQEKECPECYGEGWIGRRTSEQSIPYTCPKCKGLGKVKGKWEWEAEYRDACIFTTYRDVFTVLQYSSKYDEVKITSSGDITTWEKRDNLIPLLPWERIEQILEGMGYFFRELTNKIDSGYYRCTLMGENGVRINGKGKTRQEAVYAAVIELGKEIK